MVKLSAFGIRLNYSHLFSFQSLECLLLFLEKINEFPLGIVIEKVNLLRNCLIRLKFVIEMIFSLYLKNL